MILFNILSCYADLHTCFRLYIENKNEICQNIYGYLYVHTITPITYSGERLFGIAGKAISFDGTGSTDNHYVASYKWDFGDGTTSTEARPKHTYSEAETYKVSLTVYDIVENYDTHNTEMEIYGEDYNAVKLRVREDNWAVLSGARVYCKLAGGKSVHRHWHSTPVIGVTEINFVISVKVLR